MTCQGIFGRLFGHDYMPVYSKGAPRGEFKGLYPDTYVQVIEATKPITYHHHICTRCGHVVNKGEPE